MKWIRKIISVARRIGRSIIFQYLVYLAVAGVVSLRISFEIFYPEVRKAKCNYFQAWVETITKEAPLRANGVPDLTRGEALRRLNSFEVWVTDEQGKVLAQTEPLPLPLSFSQITLPEEEMEVVPSPVAATRFRDLYVLRLVHKDPRFLVMYPNEVNAGTKLMVNYMTLLFWWGLGVSLLGMFFLLRWRDKNEKRLESQAGFSLLSALVALVLMGISLVAMQRVLATTFKGGAHADLRNSIRSLSDTVRKNVDCGKTFDGLDLNLVCKTGTLLPLLLKDKNGVPLTKPLTALRGSFDPLEGTVRGAGQIGNWYLRASCELPDGNLTIRYARIKSVDASGKADFFVDPLTKRAYSWENSDTNPLFGSADRSVCRGSAGSGASHIAQKLMELAPLAVRDCTPSFTKNGKIYLAVAGGLAYTALMPDSTLVTATVTCPVGTVAVGGGAQCGVGGSLASLVALLGGGGKAPGYLSLSQPSDDGKGWTTACCMEGVPAPPNWPKAYAVCMPTP